MKAIKKISVLAVVICVFCAGTPGRLYSQKSGETPPNISAALIVKLAALEKNISSREGNLSIYVLGAPKVAAELSKLAGRNIGKAVLKNILQGESLPAEKPDLLYIGNASLVNNAITYTRSNKILSVTGIPELVEKGITLGIGVGEDGKPKIILNLSSTLLEGLDWNPAILKFAKTIK